MLKEHSTDANQQSTYLQCRHSLSYCRSEHTGARGLDQARLKVNRLQLGHTRKSLVKKIKVLKVLTLPMVMANEVKVLGVTTGLMVTCKHLIHFRRVHSIEAATY